MAEIRSAESQEKFHYFFVIIVVALLGAAVLTAKFEGLGKYGIALELAGWLLLMLSLVTAFLNAWNVQHLFSRSSEAERARAILDRKDIPPDVLMNTVERMDRLNSIFSELEEESGRRFKSQLAFFILGIFCIAAARGLDAVMMLKTLWWPA